MNYHRKALLQRTSDNMTGGSFLNKYDVTAARTSTRNVTLRFRSHLSIIQRRLANKTYTTVNNLEIKLV